MPNVAAQARREDDAQHGTDAESRRCLKQPGSARSSSVRTSFWDRPIFRGTLSPGYSIVVPHKRPNVPNVDCIPGFCIGTQILNEVIKVIEKHMMGSTPAPIKAVFKQDRATLL
jgi:hypothetical protein